MKHTLQLLLSGAAVFAMVSCAPQANPDHDGYGHANTVNPYGTPQTDPNIYPPVAETQYPAAQPAPTNVYTPAVPAPAPEPQVAQYTVVKGDTLYSISRRYNTTVSAIQQANSLTGSLIHPGQVLTIPQ